jgi:hypothetical protein
MDVHAVIANTIYGKLVLNKLVDLFKGICIFENLCEVTIFYVIEVFFEGAINTRERISTEHKDFPG